MSRKITDEYHTIRQQLDIADLDTVAEQVTQYIMDDPDINKAAIFHARQQMEQMNLEIPDDTSDCGIYWTLISEYHTKVLIRVLEKLSPHW